MSAWSKRLRSARDRALNFIFGIPPYDESNANDDHGRKSRMDYSVFLLSPGTLGLRTPAGPAVPPVWERRAVGAKPTAAAVWVPNGGSDQVSAFVGWDSRRSSTNGSGISNYVYRAGSTDSEPAVAWIERRTGFFET